MPSETFYCPQCSRKLTKSAQAYILGETMTSKDSSFVVLGGMAGTVTCPACGRTIDAKRMIAGEYDHISRSGNGYISVVGFAAGFVLVVVALDQPWWSGVIGGFVSGILAEMGWMKVHGL